MPLQVFGDCAGKIAGKTLRGCVTGKNWPVRLGFINANQATTRRGEPEPIRMIQIDLRDPAAWQTFVRSKESETALAITRQSTAEPDPNTSSAIFGERVRHILIRRGQIGLMSQVTQSAGCGVPTCQPIDGANRANPNTSLRVLKQAKHLWTGQPILGVINCERTRRLNVCQTIGSGKRIEPCPSANPPFALTTLQRNLFANPAGINML